ncbi:unnamed protein product [Clonostachys solani]|uniref:Cytochrome b5 heme-binding domain-containing protein n=1 Tax=Clonostachys solani TaxID=160281 RepID=A0A9N9ZK93_9HYPO|nr:unnamed protein product [Clonostachys solani]
MTTPRSFTLQEVAKHNGTDDLYMVIRNKVYDSTSFLKKHPGGEDVLLEVAGTDATEAYDEVGHGETADRLLSKLYVGELVLLVRVKLLLQLSSGGEMNWCQSPIAHSLAAEGIKTSGLQGNRKYVGIPSHFLLLMGLIVCLALLLGYIKAK